MMVIKKKMILAFILGILQLNFTQALFATQSHTDDQQQTYQDQHQDYDSQTDDQDDNDGLYGVITDSRPNGQTSQTNQIQDQSTTNSTPDIQANDGKPNDNTQTQVHICIFPPPHKGHDPCTFPGGCRCPGNDNGIPCYADCWVGQHTWELEKKPSTTCIICGKTTEPK